MKKKKGIIVIILMLAITAFMCYTAVFGWGPTGTGAAKHIKTGLDLSGGVSITYEADEAAPSAENMSDTIYKLQQRVDQYSTEASVYQEGTNRISVEIPGVTDANQILQDLGTPGSLYFIAEKDSSGNENYTYSSSTGAYELNNKTIEDLEADGSIVCEGSDVADAQGTIQQDSTTKNKQYVVELTFTADGTTKFANATTTAYSNGESIGIYYDGKFVSVPKVNAAITDGKAVIEGMSSIDEAKNLASYIRIGGLSLTLNEIRSNVVGAQLGQEAIRTSLIGGAIGLAIVCLIMIIAYLVPGVIASFALLLYVALMLLLLNAFDLTLTLPGIAGIILSIGMAVDANVIIYARISEEITAGTTVAGAIKAGFHKAMSAIIDGNVTTLIAAAVLGALGTGSIRGFAITLALGVVLSMFTALVISKLLVNAVYAVGIQNPKHWSRMKQAPHLKFVENRKKFFLIGICCIMVGVVAMIGHAAAGERALNFSLDFLGGTATTVEFNEDYSLSDLDSKVKPVVMEVTGDADVSMQKVVNSNQVIIKTRDLSVTEREALSQKLVDGFGVSADQITAESISATVGNEMRQAAILAVIIAVVLMLLYIFIRFKDMRFATSAIIALLHDVLIVLASYALLRISVGNSFIAVMLTILGYSINSTIVIFDRIREKLPTFRKGGNLSELVNEAINQTLTRSIFTNLTTFASIFVLYMVGVASIKEFTLPMMVGIAAGMFSSVCITGSLWYWMRTHLGKDRADYSEMPEDAAAEQKHRQKAVAAVQGAKDSSVSGETVQKAAAPGQGGHNPNVIRKKKKK